MPFKQDRGVTRANGLKTNGNFWIMAAKDQPQGPEPAPEAEGAASGKPLSAAARRALEEAAERRRRRAATEPPAPEVNGPKGPEPTRYGDWERKGRVTDF